jgi:hypothetical protein
MQVSLEIAYASLLLSEELLHTLEQRVHHFALHRQEMTACHVALWASRAPSGLGRRCHAVLHVIERDRVTDIYESGPGEREMGTIDEPVKEVFDKAETERHPPMESSTHPKGIIEWLTGWFEEWVAELPAESTPEIHHLTRQVSV